MGARSSRFGDLVQFTPTDRKGSITGKVICILEDTRRVVEYEGGQGERCEIVLPEDRLHVLDEIFVALAANDFMELKRCVERRPETVVVQDKVLRLW